MTQKTLIKGSALGSIIAVFFGLAFMVINSQDLSNMFRTLVLAIGASASIVVFVFAHRQRKHETAGLATSPFKHTFAFIVLAEAIMLFGGIQIVNSINVLYGPAWVALIVGIHFFALAFLFKLTRFSVLAASMSILGLGGFALGLGQHPAYINEVSGLGSGMVLIVFALYAIAPRRAS